MIDEAKQKIHRITFSAGLAKYLAGKTKMQAVKLKVVVGGEVSQGETSDTGLYAICKKKNGWPLRISMFKGIADFWRHDSRTVHECYAKVLGKI